MTLPLALSNQRVQRLRRLVNRRDSRREEGVLVVEGAVLLREAAAAGLDVECQFVSEHASPVDVGGTVFHLADGVMERVASTESPQSVIGIVRMPHFSRSVLDVVDFVVVANGVADPGNLGTMLRSAEGSGARAFVVTPGTVDYTNPKVVRAAAGSLFRLPVLEVPDIDDLRSSNLVTIGTTSHDAPCYTDVDLTRRIAVILGNEPRGLDENLEVDEWMSIPLVGNVESLNVAMACSVVCFEVARQRRGVSDTVEAT
ncbi:MAG: TrmH family RNA methyltransferase [Actinomycetota bacterium]